VAVTGDVPVLTAVKAPMFPLPLASNPMLMVLFVHAYVVVPSVLVVAKLTAAVLVLLQTT
jgi:hypothetical protein